MLEYQIDENLYKTLEGGVALGTASHGFIRSDREIWRGRGGMGNFMGVGSVVFDENNEYRVVTHLQTMHSGSGEGAERLMDAVTPKVRLGELCANLINGQFNLDGLKINSGIQYINLDHDPTGLFLEGAHSLLFDGAFRKSTSYTEFRERLAKYQELVSAHYQAVRNENDPDRIVLPFAALPNERLNPFVADLIVSYRERDFGTGNQEGPGGESMRQMIFGPPSRRLIANLMEASGHETSDLELNSFLWPKIDRKHTWDDLFVDEQQYEISQLALTAIQHPERFRDRSLNPYKHAKLLFNGPRGLGKTLGVEALANQAEAAIGEKFLVYKTTYGSLASKWRGAEARGVKALFNQLRDKLEGGYTVLWFMEEMGHIGIRQGPDMKHGNELLDELLDPLGSCHEWGPVMFIGATAEPIPHLDDQLTRFGRLGLIADFSLPDEAKRKGFLDWRVQRMESRKNGSEPIFGELDTSRVANLTEYFTFADLDNIVEGPVSRLTGREILGGKYTPVTTEMVLEAAEGIREKTKGEALMRCSWGKVHSGK